MKKRKAAPAAGQRNLMPLYLIAAGVLLVLGVLIWQIIDNLPSQSSANSQSDVPYPEIERVSLTDSKAAFDTKSAVFLDVRDPASFDVGHIPGALNIPYDQLETRLNELDPASWIIPYCT